MYHHNCGSRIFQEQGEKRNTGLCLQRNLKMTLLQFHLTCQRCTFKYKVFGIQYALEIFSGYCVTETSHFVNYEVYKRKDATVTPFRKLKLA